VKRAADRIGPAAEPFAVHCGGIEAPMHDPKLDPGWGYTLHAEPSPGRHTVSCNQFLDMQHLTDKFTRAREAARTRGPASVRMAQENTVGAMYKTLVDCAGLCLFGTQVGGDFPVCEWLRATTGWDRDNDEWLRVGERVRALRHAFNLREGINPIRDFRPHGRVYGSPPLKTGPLKGVTLDIDQMARDFCAANHWDPDTGKPDTTHLRELDLEEVMDGP
jgi:aldehyde:ferredoxin oxidoreductase